MTAAANANRVPYFPNFVSTYPVYSTGVYISSAARYFYFLKHSSGVFTVFTDDLRDAGTYTINVNAYAYNLQGALAASNYVFSFQMTIVDPCYSSIVNNIASATALNVAPPSPAITTSVKLGPPTQTYSFSTYLDTVSYNYGLYATAAMAATAGTWLGTEL